MINHLIVQRRPPILEGLLLKVQPAPHRRNKGTRDKFCDLVDLKLIGVGRVDLEETSGRLHNSVIRLGVNGLLNA